MTRYQTRSWPDVVAFYRAAAHVGPRFAAMAEFVEGIARSRLAVALHPVTSHYMLRLFATEQWDVLDDQIQIEHDGEAFEVRYSSAPRARPHSVTPITSEWRKRSTDGFAALERCLHHLRWVVEEADASGR